MGVTREVLQDGDGTNYPKKGDTVEMSYDGKLANGNRYSPPSLPPQNGDRLTRDRSQRFDQNNSFSTQIGVGQVIKGWDEGVPQMSLGEKARLTITPLVSPRLLHFFCG
jgi:FKBP-type peptidyl-prolyl cis-trans isomerase